MARDITSSVQTASEAQVVRPAWAAEVEISGGFIRAWSGSGDITVGGEVYTGVGSLGGISEVEETEDLRATGITISLTGVDPVYLSAALQSIRQGLPARVYLLLLDSSRAVIADPISIWSGFTDVPEIVEGGDTATISISVESRLLELERSGTSRYTDEEQQRLWPGDRGFEFVPALQDAEVKFGP